MRPIPTLLRHLCKNGWTDRDAVWTFESLGPGNHALHGVMVTHGKGPFWHLEWRRDFPGTPPSTIQLAAAANAVGCHIKFSPWKIHPAMRPIPKLPWAVNHFTMYTFICCWLICDIFAFVLLGICSTKRSKLTVVYVIFTTFVLAVIFDIYK